MAIEMAEASLVEVVLLSLMLIYNLISLGGLELICGDMHWKSTSIWFGIAKSQ